MYGLFPLQKDCTKFFSVPQISIYVEFFTVFLAWDLCFWVIEHCGKSDNKVIFFLHLSFNCNLPKDQAVLKKNTDLSFLTRLTSLHVF